MPHQTGLPYPVGARYSSSDYYDEATDEVVLGWQVFVQKRPDGTPTGRRCFVDNDGVLCGIEIAARKRHEALRDAATDLLAALERMGRMHALMMGKVNHAAAFYDADTLREMNEAPIQAARAITKAKGV